MTSRNFYCEPSIEGEVRCLDVARIRFTQAYIWDSFSDGTPLVETIESILCGQLKPEDLPRIRVAKHQGAFWTADNRRLFVLKHCGVKCINTLCYPWDTPLLISLEFKGKYRNGLYLREQGLCRGGLTVCVRQRCFHIPFPDSRVTETRQSQIKVVMAQSHQQEHEIALALFREVAVESRFFIVRGHARPTSAWCSLCAWKTLRGPDPLWHHERKVHGWRFQCSCNRLFQCSVDLRRHSRAREHPICTRFFFDTDEVGEPTELAVVSDSQADAGQTSDDSVHEEVIDAPYYHIAAAGAANVEQTTALDTHVATERPVQPGPALPQSVTPCG
eukprot:gb/GFBE01002571.1/.p1 GENE.gb/GFBE01002571.1/~~gb/GFBE01002571.1/.p1  ORF type:complete len:331 (+),score=20.67 gb/GFBE01002571.1/:1-993(+)